MQNRMTIRGVPPGLAMDGWWLTSSPNLPKMPDNESAEKPRWPMQLALLVPAADLLFWGHAPGISLAIFAVLVFGVSLIGRIGRHAVWPAVALTLGALPVVEHVQALSVAFLCAGVMVALVWTYMPGAKLAAISARVANTIAALPARIALTVSPLFSAIGADGNRGATTSKLRVVLRNWAIPLGGALVFLALLIDANPVFAQLLTIELDAEMLIKRAIFWLGVALLVAPLLHAPPATASLPRLPARLGVEKIGINAASTIRALFVFNLLIGAHNVLDASFLFGAALPGDVTLATYAHRSAYPLLATALLAGGFALLTQPFWGTSKWIKPLMLLWLAQNALLCVSALARLDLYIAAYGLTYLRIYAAIWMALVAAGLGLLAFQVAMARSNIWVLVRLGVMAVGTLYLCCFVNFANAIAQSNLTAEQRDIQYVCGLGPMAYGATAEIATLPYLCDIPQPQINNWREWGFRSWRVGGYGTPSNVEQPE